MGSVLPPWVRLFLCLSFAFWASCAPWFFANLGSVSPIVFLDPESRYAQISYSNQAATRIFGSCTPGATVGLYAATGTTRLGTGTCNSAGYFEITVNFSSYPEGSTTIRGIQAVNGVNSSAWSTLVMNKSTTFCGAPSNRLPGAFPGGSGTVGDPFIICTAAQATLLVGLVAACSTAGLYYKLGDDLDLSSYAPWTSLCSPGAGLVGSFDGDSYHVDGINGVTNGFFGTANVLNNLYTRDVNISNTVSSVGSAANHVGSADRVRGRGVVSSTTGTVGGLFGDSSTSVTNSFFIGTVHGTDRIGGVIGESMGGTYTDLWADATVIEDPAGYDAGGVIGRVSFGSTISRLHSKGTITVGAGGGSGGGLIGGVSGGGAAVTISSCYSESNVTTSDGTDLGGLIGHTVNAMTLSQSYATGTVTATGAGSTMGGILGSANTANIVNIDTVRFTGRISASGSDWLGGLFGTLVGGGTLNLTDSYSNGNIDGANHIAGIAAATLAGTLNINTSYSNSTVTGLTFVNGVSQNGTVNNSYFNSNRTAASTTGTSLTDAQMRVQGNFVGFTFNATHWVMSTYPALFWE